MSQNVIVSVIIPVYNAEQYIVECIESVISQSFERYELILIDDGSTDSSFEICKEYEAKDARIRVFHQKNSGVSKARNVGLKLSTGIYILFADADDYFLPGAFNVFLSYASTDIDAILSNTKIVGDRNKLLFEGTNNELYSDNIIVNLKHHAVWGYLLKKKIIEDHNLEFPEDIAYSEDSIFIMSYMFFARNLQYIAFPLYAHRINPYSACNSKNYYRIINHQLKAAKRISKLKFRYKINDKAILNYLNWQEKTKRYAGLALFLKPETFHDKFKIVSYYLSRRGFIYGIFDIFSYLIYRLFQKL